MLLLLLAVWLTGCADRETTMPKKIVAGYGTWKSPLTAARVTAGALRSAGMIDYPEDGRVILAGWVLKEDLVGAVGR